MKNPNHGKRFTSRAKIAEIAGSAGSKGKNDAITSSNAYADGLAVNYDPVGAAATAQTAAQAYADGLAVNYDAAGAAAAAQSAAQSFATSADTVVTTATEAFATAADVTVLASAHTYADGLQKVPTGGATGTVLTKNSATDFDLKWAAAGGGGGGYSPGTPPVFVQFGFVVNGGNSVTLGSAPINGHLLVAMVSNPASDTLGSGWTKQIESSSGTDYGFIATKVAGASESTTQSPVSGVSTTGSICMWEVSGQGTNYFVYGVSQAEVSSAVPWIAAGNNIQIPPNTMCLAATAIVSGITWTKAYNLGHQDALDNSGTRCIAAGHATMADQNYGGILGITSGNATYKSLICLIGSL